MLAVKVIAKVFFKVQLKRKNVSQHFLAGLIVHLSDHGGKRNGKKKHI